MTDLEMDLTGKMLIAMPGIADGVFDHSLVYLCSHSAEGAMGLVVNRLTPEVGLKELLKQLEIPASASAKAQPVYFGGPVELQRGFVLHSSDYTSKVNSLEVSEDLSMTATLDVLEDIAESKGPEKYLVMLGYSGWGPGQLEGEIARNGWLTTDASLELLFETPPEEKWQKALETLGVDAISLSAEAGHA